LDAQSIGTDFANTSGMINKGEAMSQEKTPNTLMDEARILKCLASSPRFAAMTVRDALAELAENGCGHDGGAALAKAEGKS
jgi:hypothetical protein